MYKQCRTEQSAARQRELLIGLQQAMNQTHYDEITVSSLCDQMQIPRKSFYRYFSSKDGALHALIDHMLMDFEHQSELLSGGTLGDVHQDLRKFFEFWQQRRQLLDALERSSLSGVLVQRAISQAQNEYAPPRSQTDPQTRRIQSHAITFAICGLMSMVTRWHRSGYTQTPAEMAQIASTLLTKPLIQT